MLGYIVGLMLIVGIAGAETAEASAASEWRKQSRQMAAPWPDNQLRSGRLYDFFDYRRGGNGTRYGDAVMGYALVRAGLRDGRRRILRTGIRAVSAAVRQRRRWRRPSSFEAWGVAGAYNLLRRQRPPPRAFRRRRSAWKAWIRRAPATRVQLTRRYGNHWLVDAVAVLELVRTGVRSPLGHAVVGPQRGRFHALARGLISRRVPRMVGRRRSYVLSDPRDHPLAYHGLSLGLYARAVEMLGRRAGRRARRTLRVLADTSWRFAAPDGQLGYFGRGQEMVWIYTATAYGAETAARFAGRRRRARYRALSNHALRRLRTHYEIGPRGQHPVPALNEDYRDGLKSMDRYAGAPSMGGLALVFANWTAAQARRAPRGRLAADRPRFARTFSRQFGRFAVVRRKRLWYAVKARPAHFHPFKRNLQWDFGLIAMKRRVRGRWQDVVPIRPRTIGSGRDSAGPVLRHRGRTGLPAGRRIRVGRGGKVTVRGGFEGHSGRIFRRAVFRFRPVRCGVALTFRARRGRYELSSFFGRGHVARRKRRIVGRGARVRFNVRGRTKLQRWYHSAQEPKLWRARYRFRVGRTRRVRALYC